MTTTVLVLAGLIGFAALTYIRAVLFTKRAEQETPASGQFISIDGAKLHYVKAGEGPPLILLHGAGGHLKDFTYDLVARLAKTHTVIAFDRPGSGHTPILSSKPTLLAEQADLIHKASVKLGVNQAYILGYSFGGSLALHMAVNTPKFVKGLVLVSAVSMPWPGKLHIHYRLASLPLIGPAIMAFVTAYYPKGYFWNQYECVFTPHSPPNGFLEHVNPNMSVRFRHFVQSSRQLIALRPQIVMLSAHYNTLKIPIEVLHGTADQSVPIHIHADKFTKVVKYAHYTKLENIGHSAVQLSPDQVELAVTRLSKNNDLRDQT